MKLLHDGAKRLWAQYLSPDDRVIIIGATGWFGRTATMLMRQTRLPVLHVASSSRAIELAGQSVECVAWDERLIFDFAPTVVIDCAFLTRDLVAGMTLDDYVNRNRALTANMVSAAALETVSRVMTISSGAAVHPVDALTQSIVENPYGRLKREAEQELAGLAAHRGINAVIARAWSVSGAFVQKPHSYALSDMILQARAGAIEISATMPVYRRYCSVEDLLAVSLAHASIGSRSLIDSGGPLLEMQELAEAVIEVVNPGATIHRAPLGDAPANTYYPPAEPWDEACAELGFGPALLPEQIGTASAGLPADA